MHGAWACLRGHSANLSRAIRPRPWAAAGHEARRKVATMAHQDSPKAYVRWPEGSTTMTISVTVNDKHRNLNRDASEPVEKALFRLQNGFAPKPNKKKQRKGPDEEPTPPPPAVALYSDAAGTAAVAADTDNARAWVTGGVLVIDTHRFQVERCPGAGVAGGEDAGPVLSRERAYTPGEDDVGMRLLVTCVPGRAGTGVMHSGEPLATITGVVEAGPAGLTIGPGNQLSSRLPAVQPPLLRCMTYNLLADQYASQEHSQKVLFKHVPLGLLDIEYRKQLVLHQLLASNADVMCLQEVDCKVLSGTDMEVDCKVFERYLQPNLSAHGYEGIFTNKAGQVAEGSSIFFRRSRFTLTSRRDINLRDTFTQPLAPAQALFQPMLDASPHLVDALTKVTTIAQIAVLTPTSPNNSERALAVANTHLFFHSEAPHIRTMHVAAVMAEAATTIDAEAAAGRPRPALLFCGDLNSDLNDGVPGVVQLLRTGALAADYWDWVWGADFSFARDAEARAAAVYDDDITADAACIHAEAAEASVHPEAAEAVDKAAIVRNTRGVAVTGVPLTLPFRFASSHDLAATNVTNYVPGFSGLLDYMWCEATSVRVAAALPVPGPDALGGYLPNASNPSDHLPLLAELAVQDAEQGAVQDAEQDAAQPLLPSAICSTSDAGAVAAAAGVIARGGVVALPTDTLYGLAALGSDVDAIARVYAIKGRDASRPLAVCVASVPDVLLYGDGAHLPEGLLAALLPGPVTVILARRADAPLAANLNPGVSGIAVRVPNCGFVRSVCEHVRAGVVLTSANKSGAASAVRVDEFRDVWDLIDGVYDGGEIGGDRRGSTIVDLSGQGYRIVREGSACDATVSTLELMGVRALPADV